MNQCFGLSSAAVDQPRASGQAQTWPNRPSMRIVQDASACAEIGPFFWISGAQKMKPLIIFQSSDDVGHMVAFTTSRSNTPQTGTIRRSQKNIKSVVSLVSNR